MEFVRGLNCVIGARGTCKSTIVETLRFLFDDDPERVASLLGLHTRPADGASHHGLIAATLRGGTARLSLIQEVSGDDGSQSEVVLERDTVSESRAYVDGIKAVSDRSLFNAIEIYSQGELQEIAMSSSKRLALIDRPHQALLTADLERAQALANEVAQIGPRLRALKESIAASTNALREGAPLRQQLSELRAKRPALSNNLAALRERHQAAERLLERAGEVVARARDDRARFEDAVAQISVGKSAAAFLDRGTDSVLTQIFEEIDKRAAAAEAALAVFAPNSRLEEALVSARGKLEADSAPYFAARKTEESVNQALRQEDRLADEVARLDRISEELDARKLDLEAVSARRAEVRRQLDAVRNEIFLRRLREVDEINQEFSDRIILSLNHGARTESYQASLDALLGGSRLRDQPGLCRQIAAVLPPAEFVARIEDDDAAGLAQILNRDEGQMLRLVSHVAGHEALYRLEQELSDDELEITMIVEDRARSVAEMSKGQKATAILPLVLRDAPYPLILDQPEDDLDNRFIYDTLVTTIARLKARRQLIFVTHNANIPVVGGADRVFVMTMADQDHAAIDATGTVDDVRDDILSLLEGGRAAFERRGEVYKISDDVDQ